MLTTAWVVVQPVYGGEDFHPEMSPEVERVEHDSSVFGADPTYEEKPYDIEAQIQIYGGKRAFDQSRPIFEIGRPIYTSGQYTDYPNLLGEKNPLSPHLYLYGDFRSVFAFNDNGGDELSQFAWQANLELDLGITSTERIHAFFQPLDRGGQFTRWEVGGDDEDEGFEDELNGNLSALFFEGDLGAIAQGITDEYNSLDVPVAAGLMPLFL